MYVPRAFELADPEAIREILDRYNFALLVTDDNGVPSASHLPLIHDRDGKPDGHLLGHMARANGQRLQLEAAAQLGREVLAVFQGSHAYVSPNDYGPGPVTVPTWNYLAVHVYGVPRMITDRDEARALLLRLTATQESGRERPWSPATLDEDLMKKLVRGIQAFEIAITRVDAKAKLSQNRDPAQAARAAAALEADADSLTRETGRQMRVHLGANS